QRRRQCGLRRAGAPSPGQGPRPAAAADRQPDAGRRSRARGVSARLSGPGRVRGALALLDLDLPDLLQRVLEPPLAQQGSRGASPGLREQRRGARERALAGSLRHAPGSRRRDHRAARALSRGGHALLPRRRLVPGDRRDPRPAARDHQDPPAPGRAAAASAPRRRCGGRGGARVTIDQFVEQLCELELDPELLRSDPRGERWLPAELRRMAERDPECARELAEFVAMELALFDVHEPSDAFFTRRVLDRLPEIESIDDRRRTWILASAYALAIGVAYLLLG